MATITGGCLCGAVRYTADADPSSVTVCHCLDCQKFTGSAFSVVIGVPKPAVTIEVSNPVCGDILRISVLVDGLVVTEARYKTRGCTASIAAGSALTEWITGKSKQDLIRFRPDDVEEIVGGLSPESKHAAVLCADAVKKLVAQAF